MRSICGSAAIDYLWLGLGNTLATQVPGSTSSGALNVSGGTLTFNSALQVGDFGGTGSVTQTAGNVVFGTPGTPVSLNIGDQGGTGTYNLSGGTVTFGNSATDFVTLGRNTQGNPSSGTLNLSGGTFNVANGALFIGSNVTSTGSQGTGMINQTGGTLAIGSASRLYLAAAGNGTYKTCRVARCRLVEARCSATTTIWVAPMHSISVEEHIEGAVV
ncbi:hypothetical protein AB3X96_25660 [Paraburkholderia sp. BR13439]|uniref:hypothetical protein n=1 Tax=Paraburkholderia sp. BR13439 TaxID=3236996 RepID=UPI0034CEC968